MVNPALLSNNLLSHLLEQIASFVGVFQATPQGYQKMTVEAVQQADKCYHILKKSTNFASKMNLTDLSGKNLNSDSGSLGVKVDTTTTHNPPLGP